MATLVETSIKILDTAWEALQDAYDLQVHVAPDVIARRIDDLDLAKEFLAMGPRGFVLKSHYFVLLTTKTVELGGSVPAAETLFDATAIKGALHEVSRYALSRPSALKMPN